jgi:hypothetical protein
MAVLAGGCVETLVNEAGKSGKRDNVLQICLVPDELDQKFAG